MNRLKPCTDNSPQINEVKDVLGMKEEKKKKNSRMKIKN